MQVMQAACDVHEPKPSTRLEILLGSFHFETEFGQCIADGQQIRLECTRSSSPISPLGNGATDKFLERNMNRQMQFCPLSAEQRLCTSGCLIGQTRMTQT
jgi:hypothetical protein